MTFYARHLPHWQPPSRDLFITWRLHGSLPAHLRRADPNLTPGQRFQIYDRVLDQATVGPLWLKNPQVAECVIEALQSQQARQLFALRSFVIMANHVHVLLQPNTHISHITKIIKGLTARDANRILHRTGLNFWQQESFDHWVRTPQEWSRIKTYIEQNPVKAGLTTDPKAWPWSSASIQIRD